MVIEELDVDLLTQDVVRRDLHSEDAVTGRSLRDTLFDLTEEHLHILIGEVHLELEVIAYFLLSAVFLLGNETEVLDSVSSADHYLVSVSFGQLDGGHVER